MVEAISVCFSFYGVDAWSDTFTQNVLNVTRKIENQRIRIKYVRSRNFTVSLFDNIPLIMLLFAFSACGGLRTGTSDSFDTLLSHAGLGHLGKGWIVCDITTRRLPY